MLGAIAIVRLNLCASDLFCREFALAQIDVAIANGDLEASDLFCGEFALAQIDVAIANVG